MKKYLVPALLATLLAACGGGGGSDSPVAVTPPALDAFTTIVSSTYITQNDTAEPTSIDAITATSPEGTESATI